MQEIYRDLLSYLITFLRVPGAMILVFLQGGFSYSSVCCLSQSAQFTGGVSKKILQRQKVLIEQVFSLGHSLGFLIKKRFFPGDYRLSTVISGL
jgi:hypothetical protein